MNDTGSQRPQHGGTYYAPQTGHYAPQGAQQPAAHHAAASHGYYQPPMQAGFPAGGPSYHVPPARSAMAVASLVLGIVALLTSFLPIVNTISFLIALLGLIFGIVGIVGVVRGKKSGKGLAIAAIVLNALAIVIVLATQSMYGAALDGAQKSLDAAGTNGSGAASGAASDATSDASQAAGDASAAGQASADHGVAIDGTSLGTDYSGNDVLIVTYSWTNNTGEATSFMAEFMPKCYQNGVELQTAVTADADVSSYTADVKPGASTTVRLGYVLSDASDVTIEVGPLVNWNDEVFASSVASVA